MVRIETTTYDHAVEQLHQTGTTQARKRVWDLINSQPSLYFVQCGSGSSVVPWVMFEGEEVPLDFPMYIENLDEKTNFHIIYII